MKSKATLAMCAFALLLSSAVVADNQSAGFTYKFSNGGDSAELGSRVGVPVSVGFSQETHNSCTFRALYDGSTLGSGASEGVQYEVVPLEELSEGIRTLVSITRSQISDVNNAVISAEKNACALSTGEFINHTSRTVQTLPIGKPVLVKLKDGTTYTVTATKW
ncbi:hypothetical protein ACLIN3_27500 (plasmid) [Pseudomonas orientalis]|uniref:hypothetical protein n=1 Tax=Pseudomonas orientalis TaxID=76758 RepID=UPI003987B5D7